MAHGLAQTILPSLQWALQMLRGGRPATHTVQKGDTLYSIALEYGLDYRDLVSWNALPDNSLIHIGQVLKLTPPQPENSAVQAT